MTPDNNHEEIRKLLVENQRLLVENNQLLHKMRRAALLGSLFKFLWIIIVLGLPFYMYFNYIAPNMDTIKENYSALGDISKDTGYFKQLYENLRPSEQN